MATHSSILVWEIPWTDEPGGLIHGVEKGWTQLRISTHMLVITIVVSSLVYVFPVHQLLHILLPLLCCVQMMKPSKAKDNVSIWDKGIIVLPTVFLPDSQIGNFNCQAEVYPTWLLIFNLT